jgi:hypothetical protein
MSVKLLAESLLFPISFTTIMNLLLFSGGSLCAALALVAKISDPNRDA